MIDTDKLRRLAQAVSEQINCNQVWIDQDEDVRTVMVGYIGEGGDVYHVVSINPYYAEGQSLPLGKFYAAANPATVLELLDRLEVAEKERDVLRDRLALESQENGALRDSVDRACEERDALRAAMLCMERTPYEIIGKILTEVMDIAAACRADNPWLQNFAEGLAVVERQGMSKS